ncbi:MAG: sigma-E processing peptidase SpoIIGA [Eubacterium sp.]|nr:sigma-E processing peptidase SpoIIGA [Eubacterium sp.]
MIIYVDVLFLINLYVTYFQLLAVSAFTHMRIRTERMILGAAAGGAAAFTIFLPQDIPAAAAAIKIVSCLIITLISFGYKSGKTFLKNAMWLLLINFIFAGIMLAVWLFAAPLEMLYSNGTVYFDIDFFTILFFTAGAYFMVKGIRYLLDRNGKTDGSYKILIENNGGSVTLDALSDSGNGLVDWFSGLPVIVCRKNACDGISPPDIMSTDDPEYVKGVRVLPFSTVNARGYVYAFKADKIIVSDIKNGKEYSVNALVGISPDSVQEYDAIFNPKILV